MLLLVSCASGPSAYQEQGWASYVANHYAGRPTASGQLYHPQAYTAAHTSLPFGTVLTVRNVTNGRSVNVTVNDRFPYYPGRVVNLSSAAAQHIGIPYMRMGQVQVTAHGVGSPGYARPSQPASHGYAGGGYYQNPAPTYGSYSQSPAPAYGGSPYGATPAYSGHPHTAAPAYGGYTQQAPAQAPVYNSYPSYPPPTASAAPKYSAPASAPAPKYSAPTYSTKPRYTAPAPKVSGAPNAPSYGGGSSTPPGLKTF